MPDIVTSCASVYCIGAIPWLKMPKNLAQKQARQTFRRIALTSILREHYSKKYRKKNPLSRKPRRKPDSAERAIYGLNLGWF